LLFEKGDNMAEQKKDIFKTEKECFEVINKGYVKIKRELPVLRGFNNLPLNHHGTIKPPLSKREREKERSPLAVY